MSRQQVYEEIEKTLGRVPTFFEDVPDPSLESVWHIFIQKTYSKVGRS